MEIIPFPNKIFIKPDKADLGIFEQVDSRVSESGTVVFLGAMLSGVKMDYKGKNELKIGDKVYFKAWGMDTIEIEGSMYFVADIDRKNILCKVQ